VKKILVSALALSAFMALGTVAKSADAFVDPGYDWSGLYVGAQGGFGFGETTWYENRPGGGETFDGDFDGFAGGVTLGYNLQADMVVFGLESDISSSGISADSEPSLSFTCPGVNSICTTDVEWFATVRGRLGVSIGHTLPYITGGLAVGDAKGSTFVTNGEDTLVGWTAGAGVEHAFTDRLSVKLEGLYVDLGELDLTFSCGINCQTSVDFAVARLGVNYNF
jgi:outer membrane immunogenic protein